MSKNTFAKIPFMRSAPAEMAAILNKLIQDPTTNGNNRPSRPKVAAHQQMFDRISRETAQDVVDADALFQQLPDVELASQILIGSIVSPKDMATVELNYIVDGNQFDSEISRALLNVIENYYKNDYKINDRLDLILKNILFMKGASITAIIPENSLDYVINGKRRLSLETYDKVISHISKNKPMGLLGHPRTDRVSLETFRNNDHIDGSSKIGDGKAFLPNIQVGDNIDCLKLPKLYNKRRTTKMNSLLNKQRTSMESAVKGLTDNEINQLYAHLDRKTEPTRVIPSPLLFKETPVGHPLTIELPVESVIPVHVPGDPSDHVGYFILIDQSGRPVQRDSSIDYYSELRSSFGGNGKDNSSEIVRQIREATGNVNYQNAMEYEQIQEAYNRLIESDLIARLKNGVYKEEFSVGFTNEIYRIMLYRSFKAKNTQLIYIPAELVVYMAFDYNKHGIGQTLLTKSKILSSMRSVLLFAETMSGVRNAIGRKKASITIDPDDPDPQKTISDIQATILESSHRGFPLGSPDPGQILDHLNRAGFDFSINIDNEQYPATKVEYDDYNTEVRAGNTELQERLQKMHISSMGISPEWADPMSPPELEVSVITNNLLMQRRVMWYQGTFVWFLTKLVQTYTQHSGTLRAELLKILNENMDKLRETFKDESVDDILESFISAITVTLPSPDNTKIDLHIAGFDQYTQLLEKALEAYITPDLFPADLLAANSEIVTQTFAIIKAYFQRMWLERNNVLPELDQLTTLHGGDGETRFNLLDIQTNLFETVGTAVNEYVRGIQKIKEKWEAENPQETTDELGGETSDTVGDLEGGDLSSGDDNTGDLDIEEEDLDSSDLALDEESNEDTLGEPEEESEKESDQEEEPPAQ